MNLKYTLVKSLPRTSGVNELAFKGHNISRDLVGIFETVNICHLQSSIAKETFKKICIRFVVDGSLTLNAMNLRV